MKKIIFNILFLFTVVSLCAQDGHQLWLHNHKAVPVTVVCKKNSPTLSIAKQELQQGWEGDANVTVTLTLKKDKAIKNDGFRLGKNSIEATTDIGILYGVYELLREQQTSEPIKNEIFNPSYEVRMLDHWDNLNGTE